MRETRRKDLALISCDFIVPSDDQSAQQDNDYNSPEKNFVFIGVNKFVEAFYRFLVGFVSSKHLL